MAKTGRNDPCPCGSGKKYKRCCLEIDEAAERTVLTVAAPSQPLQKIPNVAAEIAAKLAAAYDADDDLTNLSNATVDLVHAGKLDEAEQLAHDLLERFPDVPDGYDRLGMIYEARGDHQKAADCYRKVIDFIRAHPEDYDPDYEATFRNLVNRLDPSAAI
jgi:tetratricopeptide (TPR) repeat protein